MDLQVKGQVAVVAAASKGLGKSAAMGLAKEGARIAICARGEALDATAEEIRSETGAEVLAVRADMTQRAEVESFIKQSVDHYGQIDILIVNCGGPPPGDFMDLTIEDWEAGVQFVRALGGLVLLRIQFEGVFHMYSLDHENLFVQLDFTDGFGCQPAFAGGDIARLQRASEGAGQSTRGCCYEVIEGGGMSGMNTRFALVVLGNLRMG